MADLVAVLAKGSGGLQVGKKIGRGRYSEVQSLDGRRGLQVGAERDDGGTRGVGRGGMHSKPSWMWSLLRRTGRGDGGLWWAPYVQAPQG